MILHTASVLDQMADVVPMQQYSRRSTLVLLGALASPAFAAADAGDLARVLDEVRAAALAAGVSRETVDRELAGLTLDPGLLARPAAQGEFSLTPRDYLARLVDAGRVAGARAQMAKQHAALETVARRTGVPAEIIVAFWALESGFGGAQGDHDVLRSLATLGASGNRRDLFRDEMVAALAILDRGEATRTQLKGSWAGAMGQPQFMPSSYLKYAVPLTGDGAPDIWRSAGDTIASIGNFMRLSGWMAGLPAVVEVAIPQAFDWQPLDLSFPQWRQHGFTRIDGAPLPQAGDANMFLPAGAHGPALLVSRNWEAIRAYNTSDAYALAVFVLSERAAGRTGLVTPWPPDGAKLTAAGRRTIQERLRSRGFYDGTVDGRFGRATRVAVHAFQIAAGIRPADGFATLELLDQLGER